jgi:hypothetical protein
MISLAADVTIALWMGESLRLTHGAAAAKREELT